MDIDEIKAIIDILKETDISEFTFEREGLRLKLKRFGEVEHIAVEPKVKTVAPVIVEQPQPSQKKEAVDTSSDSNDEQLIVKAPIVGTFYRSPTPDAASFVEVGSTVKKGQILCIIEAMKLMNEIESEVDGIVKAVLVENGHPVEYGESLFLINPEN